MAISTQTRTTKLQKLEKITIKNVFKTQISETKHPLKRQNITKPITRLDKRFRMVPEEIEKILQPTRKITYHHHREW